MPSGIRTRLASRARIGSGRHLLVSGVHLREGGMVRVPASARAAARHGQPAAGAWPAAAPTRLRHVGGLADRTLPRNGAASSGFAACVTQRSLLHGHSDFPRRNSAMYDMLSSRTCRISPRGDMLERSLVQNRRFATYSTAEGGGFCRISPTEAFASRSGVAYRRQKGFLLRCHVAYCRIATAWKTKTGHLQCLFRLSAFERASPPAQLETASGAPRRAARMRARMRSLLAAPRFAGGFAVNPRGCRGSVAARSRCRG